MAIKTRHYFQKYPSSDIEMQTITDAHNQRHLQQERYMTEAQKWYNSSIHKPARIEMSKA